MDYILNENQAYMFVEPFLKTLFKDAEYVTKNNQKDGDKLWSGIWSKKEPELLYVGRPHDPDTDDDVWFVNGDVLRGYPEIFSMNYKDFFLLIGKYMMKNYPEVGKIATIY